ncbi:LysR substrate-binding domain-containing protein, partial [Klebsiella pneumoniae]
QQGEILTTLIAEVPLVYIDRHYRQGAVEIDQIDQQRWISPGPHSLSAAIATRRDFSTTRLNVQTYYMATEFVKRGMGCSITDIFSAQHNLAPEMIHPITPPMAINLCLLRRADVSLSPMAQKFVDFLCQRLRQQLKEINLRLYPDHKKSIAPLG